MAETYTLVPGDSLTVTIKVKLESLPHTVTDAYATKDVRARIRALADQIAQQVYVVQGNPGTTAEVSAEVNRG
jgi:hypothetical protein